MPRTLDNKIDRHVGSRIRMRRLMLHLSQTELAGALGLTFQQVQKYEKGINRVSASKLQLTARFLEVPVPFFFEGAPVPSTSTKGAVELVTDPRVSEFLESKDGIALMLAWGRIRSPRIRHRILDLIEEIS